MKKVKNENVGKHQTKNDLIITALFKPSKSYFTFKLCM